MNDGKTYSYISRVKSRRRRKKLIRFFLLGLAGLSFIFGVYQTLKDNPAKNGWKENILSVQIKVEPLKKVVDDTLKDAKGTYGIAVINLKSGESYLFNEQKSFEIGSLYKLWIMALVYRDIREGKLSLDDSLTGDISTLNKKFNIASDSAELNNGNMSFTVKSALRQMITISHNYAALMLTEKVKVSRVKEWLTKNSFHASSVRTEDTSSPISTPKDIASFLEKLYKGELGDEQSTQEMLNLLKDQQLNDGLPKYLSNSKEKPIAVAHKTGEVGWFKNDAGIVFTEKGDYIIVVMSESKSPPGAQERIAILSKAVYDYFSK